eukprot:6479481-Heterocapsa_arctica.AAC.1
MAATLANVGEEVVNLPNWTYEGATPAWLLCQWRSPDVIVCGPEWAAGWHSRPGQDEREVDDTCGVPQDHAWKFYGP